MARKPGTGAIAQNVIRYGTGALNIDGCRIGTEGGTRGHDYDKTGLFGIGGKATIESIDAGRFPSNIILTDPIFDGGVEGVVGGGPAGGNAPASGPTWSGPSGSASRNQFAGMGDREPQFYGDSGTYSRFFLIPKADRADREPVLGGLPLGDAAVPAGPVPGMPRSDGSMRGPVRRQNVHPTVKPTELMRHLVRLVTPPGGVVLDPFLGSGTTALAAEMEGFAWIGIEREEEYVRIAEARLNGVQKGLGLAG